MNNGSELDRLGDRYAAHHRARRGGGEFIFVPERIPIFVQSVGGPGRHVLDLGCRTGALAANFLPGNTVVGVDVDPVALERAAERGLLPVRASAEDTLPFEDASFDAVVAGELLEHVRDPASVVGEVRRVLRPGGTFVGSVPNAFRLQSRLLFAAGRPPENDPTHLHLYSPANVRSLLDGFATVELHFVGGRARRWHPRLLARDLVFVATAPS